MNLLAVKSLSKNYHSNTVVKNITFTLQQHKCVALIGPNGAGKTTTLRMLTGLIQPSSGQITFADTKEKDYRRFIGYLPQHPVFHEWMTGEEFLVYVAKLAKIEKQTAKKLALDLLRMSVFLMQKISALALIQEE